MTGEAPSSALPSVADVAAWAQAFRREDPALSAMVADLDPDEARAAVAALLALVDAALMTSAGHAPDTWLAAVTRTPPR